MIDISCASIPEKPHFHLMSAAQLRHLCRQHDLNSDRYLRGMTEGKRALRSLQAT